jgi:hypothetical protein
MTLRRTLRATAVLCALFALACATASSNTGSGAATAARRAFSLRAGDRIVIPPMTVVRAIAMTDRYTFVATPAALGVYDRRFNEWQPPLTRIDGWPEIAVTAMMADPADPSAVWFAAENFVFHYRVGFGDVVRALVPERVVPSAFFVDPADMAAGVVVGGSSGLYRVSATGFVQPYNPPPVAAPRPGGTRARIVPQSVPAVYAQYPSLQNFERMLTQDKALRTWPVLSAASSPTNSEVWLGTAGGGLFKVDPLFSRSEQMPFGLIGEGAGAIARAADGVWIGSLGNGITPRGGLTFTDNELRTWRWIDGGMASPLSGARITSIMSWGATVWVASDRGVVQLDARTGDVLHRWDDMSGLPSAIALAVEATPDGAWVGTLRGLAFVHAAERAPGGGRAVDVDPPVLVGSAVHALTRRGDTLWVASDAGVHVLPPGADQARRLRASTSDARLNLAVSAIATADSIVVIATSNGEVLRIHTATGDVLDAASFVNAAPVGRIYGLALDARTIWVAGERGVIGMRREGGVQQFFAAGRDLPSDAFGVTLTPQYVWIATRDGAVRLRRDDDGMIH